MTPVATASSPTYKCTNEQARWIYKTMNEIRFFEEKVHKIFSDGQIPGFVLVNSSYLS
jgi:TPP-dependent pyruvate/acetoin dehydrogenase alpha subunit